MKIEINNETAQLLQSIFRDAVEQGNYAHDELNRFLFDTLAYGISIMDRVSKGEMDEDLIFDLDELIVVKKDNLFSEN